MNVSRRNVSITLGILTSIALLSYALSRLDWHAFVATVARIDLLLVGIAIPLLVGAIICRSVRWSILNLQLSHFPHYWRAATIGYLGNYILPLRGGEIARIVIINRTIRGLGIAQATLGAVVDRAYDLLVLAFLIAWVWYLHGSAALPAETVAMVLGVMVAALTGGVIFVLSAGIWGERALGLTSGLSPKAAEFVSRAIVQVMSTAAILRRPPQAIAALLLSILASTADLAAIVCLFQAFHWDLPIVAGITVLTFLQIGAALPSAPGFVGIWQIASILALSLYGISETGAVAFSVVHQLLLFALLGVLGLWSLAALGLRLSTITKAAKPKN